MKILQTLIMLLAISSTALAGRLPDHYPKDGFDGFGIVDRLDMKTRSLVIGDRYFRMSDDLRLHSRSSDNDSLGRLRERIKVGYKYRQQGQHRVVTDIWLLPSNYEEEDDD